MGDDTKSDTSTTLISKLDFGDPLYLHASDISSTPLITFKLKGTENYKSWSCAMKLALQTKNKMGFINGTLEKDEEDEVLSNQWDRCNAVVLSWILGSMSDELYSGQIFSEIASEVWDELKETYDKVDVQLPACGLTASKEFKEHTNLIKLMQFLMGLDDIYLPIRSNILMRDPLPTVKTAFSIISREESHRNSSQTVKNGQRCAECGRDNHPTEKCFKIVGFPSRNGNLKCTKCGMTNHTVDKCFEMIGYPPNLKRKGFNNNMKGNLSKVTNDNQGSTSTSAVSLSNEQVMKLLSLLDEKTCTKPASSNAAGNFMNYNVFFNTHQNKFLVSNKSSEVNNVNYGWIVDSGASQHMTNSTLGFVSSVDVSELNLTVQHPNGTLAKVTKIGNLKITEDIILQDVLVIPDYCVSLLFVHCLVRDNNLFVGFDVHACHIQDLVTKKTLVTGEQLGHPAEQALMHLKGINLANNENINIPCDVCYKAKQTNKFSERAEKCVFMGYSSVKKGYKFYSLDNKSFFISRDVNVHESQQTLSPNDDGRDKSKSSIGEGSGSKVTLNSSTITTVSDVNVDHTRTSAPTTTPIVETVSPEGIVSTNKDSYSFTPSVRRSQRDTAMPKRFNEYVVEGKVKYGIEKVINYSKLSKENLCFVSTLNKSVEPSTYWEACKSKHWVDAMNLEMEALHRNDTWELSDLPSDREPIGCKWIYRIKYKSNGEIDRYKARLVAKGFNQREGVDFDETFSPVVKMITVRCLINIAIQNSWSLFQLDINNAFLYGDHDETFYMTLPLALVENGFNRSKNDYSLFIKSVNGVFIALLVYVDDIVVTGNNVKEILKFKKFLSSKFKIKDLGVLKYFLGIEVIRSNTEICLSQRKYTLDLLSEFGLLGSKPCQTPIKPNVKFDGNKINYLPLTNITEYQRLVGKLIYLTLTRPDISYSVHVLSQFMHSPRVSHLKCAMRVLKYLKSAPGLGICVKRSDENSIVAFVDSDWGKGIMERKSITGYCLFLNGSIIGWKSKKQSAISRSSAEAEYRALADASCEVIWVLKLLDEFEVKYSLPVPMFMDDSAAIKIASNPVFQEKTKHFGVDLHFVREKISSGVLTT
ncbi:uncharacterized protein [Rutidosis leptorrhynchoides]|uniref:uncharacterized protein n=1 Tax=Rutidosis leptorrhynchoides TaxID=125765 RepID=UPI003A99BC44